MRVGTVGTGLQGETQWVNFSKNCHGESIKIGDGCKTNFIYMQVVLGG